MPNEETEEEEATTSKKRKAVFKRTFLESYLKYGFIATDGTGSFLRNKLPLIQRNDQAQTEADQNAPLIVNEDNKRYGDLPSTHLPSSPFFGDLRAEMIKTAMTIKNSVSLRPWPCFPLEGVEESQEGSR
ncbi:uncharacterized protein ACBT44_007239 isoform 1-T1 [Syngnathus typhle]